MKIGLQQVAIAALPIGCFAAGYGVSFLKLDSRESEEAYINLMRQCVFLGERENQCAEEWRSMDTQERFFYSESGRRAQAKFQRKKREEDERTSAECEALSRNDASCKIEQFMKAKKKIE